jgi:DNA-binding NarL/FixJ family response regulator
MPGLALACVADSPTDAILAFEAHRPEVVILDLALRGGSGLEVLREIKLRTPACRVLVFTGHDTEATRTRCRAAGADFFFSKNREHREFIAQLEVLAGETG